MIEWYEPRTAARVPPGGFSVAAATTPEGTDPISGREWVTNSTTPSIKGSWWTWSTRARSSSRHPETASDAATLADPTLVDACNCQPPSPNTGSFSPAQIPAVCNSTTPTLQDSAKAYPTVREILLAKLLGEVSGANPGVVSSICPIHESELSPGDPLYGYRPAISSLIDRCMGR